MTGPAITMKNALATPELRTTCRDNFATGVRYHDHVTTVIRFAQRW